MGFVVFAACRVEFPMFYFTDIEPTQGIVDNIMVGQ
jgi:hypothetical protein